VIPVQPRTAQANAFVGHLAQHHYLGYGGAAGQNLRYLIRDCDGRDLAACSLALRPGKSEPVIPSSAGVLSSARSDSR
jgi:hypothetical protein